MLSKVVFVFLVTLLFFVSCKKNEKNTISGVVTEHFSNTPVEGVKVELSAQKVESGTFSSLFSSLGTYTSDAGGKFSFEFDAMRASKYRLVFTKNNYFNKTEELIPTDINQSFDENISVHSKAYLKVHIKNSNPYDYKDKMNYSVIHSVALCSDCCSDSSYLFTGMMIDEFRKCRIYGNQNLVIDWFVTKKNTTHFFSDTVFCPSFDTTLYELFY